MSANQVTADDITSLREDFFVHLKGFSDERLIAALDAHPHLLHLGRMWGWNDTQVRDEMADALDIGKG